MIWYSKYLQVYNKTFQATSTSIIEEVRGKLRDMNSDSPLVSVVIIAHNEETRILACIWSLCDNSIDFPIEIMAINNNSTDRTVDVLNQTGIRWFNEEKTCIVTGLHHGIKPDSMRRFQYGRDHKGSGNYCGRRNNRGK